MLNTNIVKVFESGAKRTTDADNVSFDLICPTAMARVAAIYREGSDKYGPVAWCRGLPISDTLNHAIRHLNLYMSGDKSEDNLAKVCWGILAVMHYESGCTHHRQHLENMRLDEQYVAIQERAERASGLVNAMLLDEGTEPKEVEPESPARQSTHNLGFLLPKPRYIKQLLPEETVSELTKELIEVIGPSAFRAILDDMEKGKTDSSTASIPETVATYDTQEPVVTSIKVPSKKGNGSK